MPSTVVYLIYNLLLPVFLVIGLPSFLLKGLRRGGLARNFRQRFGNFSPDTLARFRGKKPLWIHAVSVGEIFLALKIIDAIRQADPGQHIVLSTTTATGYRIAAEKECDTLTVIHNPVDLPFVTARVIRLMDPSRLVLIEAEIWPNLVAQLKRRGTPVLLINARLSPRSERRYLKCKAFIAPIFSLLDGVTVPFEVDQARWAGLGIPRERILVTGSVKFDNAATGASATGLHQSLAQWLTYTGMPEDRRLLIAGSTHDGEEKMIALVAYRLCIEAPELALVIVPRHAERGAAIASQLSELGFDPILRVAPKRVESDTGESWAASADAPRGPVWIANTTGELRAWFHLAELVVIGKSFCSEGGQNPVEPILCGKPVVVGPHMENFSDVVTDLLAVEGIAQVSSEDALPTTLLTLLRNRDLGLEMARSGAAAMARHEGAAARNAAFLLAVKSLD